MAPLARNFFTIVAQILGMHRRVHVGGAAGNGSDGLGLDLVLLERLLRAVEGVLAEAVVRVDDRHVGYALGGELAHDRRDLDLHRCAQVEKIAAHRLVHLERAAHAGEDQRLLLLEHRHHGLGVGGAAKEEEREDLLLVDELLRVLHRALRIEAVVHHLEHDRAAVDPALGVDLVEIRLGGGDGLLDRARLGAAVVGGLAQDEGLGMGAAGGSQRDCGEYGSVHQCSPLYLH
jgi:hypothetical protein